MEKIIKMDVIIISYAYNSQKRALTEQTIQSLIDSESEDQFIFNVYVIESEKNTENYNYRNTITIKPNEKFGYHKYLNIGAKSGNSPWIVLANNDLIFKKNWASAIINAKHIDPEIQSFGAYCEKTHPELSIKKEPIIQYGYQNLVHITGWIIVLTRDLYNDMNGLDEDFIFWYCDNDYRMTLIKMGIKHALITNSEVVHIGSQTIVETDKKTHTQMTLIPNLQYDYKWNHRSYIVFIIKKTILRFKLWLDI